MERAPIPDNARTLVDVLAIAVGVPAGGRLELVYDDELRCRDAFIKPPNARRSSSELATTIVFCRCIGKTSVVYGRCVTCRLLKCPEE